MLEMKPLIKTKNNDVCNLVKSTYYRRIRLFNLCFECMSDDNGERDVELCSKRSPYIF